MITFKPCPLCGKTKRLAVTPEERYTKLRNEHGSACVIIECLDCNLELRDHTADMPEYSDRIIILKDKWNHLPRRGDGLDRIERRNMVIEDVRQALDKLENEWSENR